MPQRIWDELQLMKQTPFHRWQSDRFTQYYFTIKETWCRKRGENASGTSGRQSVRRVEQEALCTLRKRRRGQILRAIYSRRNVSWHCNGIYSAIRGCAGKYIVQVVGCRKLDGLLRVRWQQACCELRCCFFHPSVTFKCIRGITAQGTQSLCAELQ